MYFLLVLGKIAPSKIPEYSFWEGTFSLQ